MPTGKTARRANMNADTLVLGAMGNVGTEVVKALQAKGASIRAAGSSPTKVKERFGEGVEAVYFNFTKPGSYEETFKGIEKMFLMRPPQISRIRHDIYPALDASRAAGVRQVVFLSIIGIEDNKVVPHYKIEQYLRSSGQDYTFLRCSFFMQNLNTTHLEEIRDSDNIFIPVNMAKTSFIDVRDIGAVGAVTLTERGHEKKAYELTGSEALDYHQVAKLYTSILGRPITYRQPTAAAYFLRQLGRKQPIMFALISTWLYSNTKNGMADKITGEVKALIGRKPITMQAYIEDYRGSWCR
jgi:uncharacterized protein YbjT (DUF2867 family)